MFVNTKRLRALPLATGARGQVDGRSALAGLTVDFQG
jgi:hypothetical protein